MIPKDEQGVSPASPNTTLSELQTQIVSSPTLRALQASLDRLPISADAKAATLGITHFSVKGGGRVLRLGRLIIDFVIKLANDYPNTAFALVLSIVVTTLIGSVPWVGPFLAGVIGPLLSVLAIFFGGISDMRAGALSRRIDGEAAALAMRTELLARIDAAEKSGLLDRIEAFEKRIANPAREVIELGGARRVE